MSSRVSHCDFIERFEDCLNVFQKRINKKRKPGTKWLSDASWGAALCLTGDYAGHESPNRNRSTDDQTLLLEAVDKSKLAKYRSSAPTVRGTTMPQDKVRSLVRGIARMYGCLAPMKETLIVADEFCRHFGFEFAPGGMIFGIESQDGYRFEVISSYLKIPTIDLLSMLEHSYAIHNYCKYGMLHPLSLLLTFRQDNPQNWTYWGALAAKLKAVTGCVVIPSGFCVDTVAFDINCIRNPRESNIILTFENQLAYTSSLSNWLSEFRTKASLAPYLDKSMARLSSLTDQVFKGKLTEGLSAQIYSHKILRPELGSLVSLNKCLSAKMENYELFSKGLFFESSEHVSVPSTDQIRMLRDFDYTMGKKSNYDSFERWDQSPVGLLKAFLGAQSFKKVASFDRKVFLHLRSQYRRNYNGSLLGYE